MAASSGDLRSARVANFLKNRRGTGASETTGIERRNDRGPVEVSEEQKRIWLHCALSGSSEMYNDTFSLRYSGNLNVNALERALNEIVRRHEVWRSSFELIEDKILQSVAQELRITFPVSDLRNVPLGKREKRLAELTAEDSRKPFRLSQAPLFRARLVQLAADDFRFTLVIHHLISDGVSVYQVLLSELEALYSAFAQDVEPNLPPLPFQYSDYAEWQRRQDVRSANENGMVFWERQLQGELPVMKLPLDRPRPAIRKFDGGTESFRLSPEVTSGLKQTAHSWDATVFMTALSAFYVLVYHYTGESDQILGCVTSTRKQFGTEALLGVFINMLPLRAKLAGGDLFPELVHRVRENTLAALENEVSFDVLVRRFGRRVPSITPLFQVVFVFEPSTAFSSEEWRLEDRSADNPFTKWDLALVLQEDQGQLAGRFSYSREIFDAPTIARMRDKWVKLLGEIVSNPNRTLDQLSVRLADEQSPASTLRRLKTYLRNVFSQLA
jgi:hypothetical protein